MRPLVVANERTLDLVALRRQHARRFGAGPGPRPGAASPRHRRAHGERRGRPEDRLVGGGLGAYGYVMKPFQANEILIAADNALRRRQLEIENRAPPERLERLVAERTRGLGQDGPRSNTFSTPFSTTCLAA